MFNREGKMQDAVEGEVQKNGGPIVQRILVRKRKLVLKPDSHGKNQRMGDEDIEQTLQDEKDEDEAFQVYCKNREVYLEKDEVPLPL